VIDNMKVCVIDDNLSITGMIEKLLLMKGHTPIIINNPHEGLKRLQNENFDSVILDIAMPELSGIDILNALTESGRIKEQNICVLTASSAKHDFETIKVFGIKEYLLKPVDLDNLVGVLERISK